jgi:hypothetical protein
MHLYNSIFPQNINAEYIVVEKILFIKLGETSLEFVFAKDLSVKWNYQSKTDRDKELKTFLLMKSGEEIKKEQ